MKRPRFRLEAVLHLRERELASAMERLAGHLRAEREAADQRAKWLARISDGERALSARLSSGLSAGAAQITNLAIDASRANAQKAGSICRAYEAPIAGARNDVLEARRRVRALEILRDRFHRTERERAARHRQGGLDEIGLRTAQGRRQ